MHELHATVLFEIQCVRANWGGISHLGSGVPRADNPKSVFICCDFQHEPRKHQKDHFGSPRGECNGFSTFVPGAGLTCGFSHVNRNSLKSVPCSSLTVNR